ncbi:MAG: alpha-hydroxy-acid oxidizing protein [Rhodospirillales bacterium]|nr:MAG: alpha-hydroxy-acid oxidizing protein [Rhodospirillales bacterium]
MRRVMCLEDLESPCRSFLPRALWEFASVGVEGNLSRDGNRQAFDDIWLYPRVLNDVSQRSIERRLFDKAYDAPFGIAPMGASAMFGYQADLNFARAAHAANIPFILSGSALIPMERVVEANPDTWFQAYVHSDRAAIGGLAGRAWQAGIRHLVVTVDVPVPGNRGSSLRSGFGYPIRPSFRIAFDGVTHPRWLFGTFLRTLLSGGLPHLENTGVDRGLPIMSLVAPKRSQVHADLNWEDLAWLRDRWKGKLLIKGVLSAEDTTIASRTGLDGIIVSNHGGRQLETAVPPLKVLPDIVREKGDMAILFDSGIRRGTDVVKALALGADFVFVGRPFLYAAALGRESGVSHAINLLAQEVDRNLALLGCTELDQLGSRLN